jgi:hypothetical protein
VTQCRVVVCCLDSIYIYIKHDVRDSVSHSLVDTDAKGIETISSVLLGLKLKRN